MGMFHVGIIGDTEKFIYGFSDYVRRYGEKQSLSDIWHLTLKGNYQQYMNYYIVLAKIKEYK